MSDTGPDGRDVSGELTVIIKAFQRPKTAAGAIESIRRFYPELRICVCDDGHHPVEALDDRVIVFRIPFDSGVSKGRNYLLREIQTRYFLVMDDDHYFSRHTRLEVMLRILKSNSLDILAGRVLENPGGRRRRWWKRRDLDFAMNLEFESETLRFVNGYRSKSRDFVVCDLVPSFFVARTDRIRSMGGWDERLKIAEHTEFFLRAKRAGLRTGYARKIRVDHIHLADECSSEDYAPYRKTRAPEFRRIWLETYGIKKVVTRTGRSVTAEEFIQHGIW